MRTSYSCLMKMLADAQFAHDMFWDLGLYNEAYRYTRIAQRILKAVCNPVNKFDYLK